MSLYDTPLAVNGLNSYRYRGAFGWVMIGAKDDQDALSEARRSGITGASLRRLQKWCDTKCVYQPVKQESHSDYSMAEKLRGEIQNNGNC